MSLLKKLKERVFRKNIYMDVKNVIYKTSDNEYFFENNGVSSIIRLCSDKGRNVILFNVKVIERNTALINFAITYDSTKPIDDFIIAHCLENPIFMVDPMDIPSIKACTTKANRNQQSHNEKPLFINRVGINRKKFDSYMNDSGTNKNLHSFLFISHEVYSDDSLVRNKHSVFVGDVEYQLISLKKKRITNLSSKIKLYCHLTESDTPTEILTVYDINGVICVLKNIFDIVILGIDNEWLLYTDRTEIDQIISKMFYYLHLYIDLCSPPLLFHRNSPCKFSRTKDNFIIEYIDGYRTAEVNVKISKTERQSEIGVMRTISKNEMNLFFYNVLRTVGDDVFKLCANHPSKLLLKKLDDLGFHDCMTPIDSGIIEVLKMHDY